MSHFWSVFLLFPKQKALNELVILIHVVLIALFLTSEVKRKSNIHLFVVFCWHLEKFYAVYSLCTKSRLFMSSHQQFCFSYFSIIFADYSNCRNILSILFVTRRYIDELQLDSWKNITENENCFWYIRLCVKTQIAKYLQEKYWQICVFANFVQNMYKNGFIGHIAIYV